MQSKRVKRVMYVHGLVHATYARQMHARPDIRLDQVENDTPDDVVAPILASAHAYQVGAARDELAQRFHVSEALLRRMPELLIVSSNGAGYDTVDVAACTKAGVLVVNQAGGNAHSVAEHILAMMLGLAKRIVETDHAMRRPGVADRNRFIGSEVAGKTIGIVGLGHVGTRIAELCRGLLRMRVIASDPYLSTDEMAARGAEKMALDELLSIADFVSVSCPLTNETRGMIGTREFALMRSHAYFIITARGFIHDEAALVEALRQKAIAGAGLDVWAKEPPPPNHPLMQFDNVIVSPHTAGVTKEARETMGRIASEQLIAAFDGARPKRLINPDAWPRYAERFSAAFGFTPGKAAASQ
jgi:D-3-phosphoglycerate dehydrogenase / 2-oxoglutarate reductase